MKRSLSDNEDYSYAQETDITRKAPQTLILGIGIFFAVGSALFAWGSIYGYILGYYSEGFELFIGSLFFTAAALIQYFYTIKISSQSPENLFPVYSTPDDNYAALIQVVGTIFFNISTYVALKNNLLITSLKNQVWSPDFFGSVCFLLACGLLWFNGKSLRNSDGLSWWMLTLILLGSVAFFLSALTAYVLHKTGVPQKELLMNTETFIGSICFLSGALLLLMIYRRR